MNTQPKEAYQRFFNSANAETKRQHLIADFDIATRENTRLEKEKNNTEMKVKKIIWN